MIKIVLDAGHGKNTPGKRCPDDSLREWQFNAAVAAMAKGFLDQYENVEVKFTHDPTGAVDVPLLSRTNTANAWGATVFVSIHANASGSEWSDADGIETFTYITKPNEAMELAALVQQKLVAQTGRDNRGVKQADFHVLRESHMTAILVECGFMTNKTEATLLKSADYRERCARAITEALAEHYKLQKKPVPTKPLPPAQAPVKPSAGYHVQVGSFANISNAQALQKQLLAKGFSAIIKEV